MQYSTLALCILGGVVKQGLAGYTLADDYSPSNFFSMFSFFTSADPTNGYVQYLDQNTAQNDGLVSSSGSSIYMGVDHTNVATGAGRSSVRITSNKAYNHGLVILDASHMPEGCGTWPAFWMVGPNWPNQGEIDIIEGVNEQVGNAMTLHTGPDCSINNSGFTGNLGTSNCYVNAPGQSNNQGCGITSSNANTYGSGFNQNQGGVYATEWKSDHIAVWFFPRGSTPADITNGNPNPSNWGEPLSYFAGSCSIDSSFKSLQIVFDTTFCGDWAGNVWSSGSCASKASTCQQFVQNNPGAFANAYWTVNSLKVYQDNGVSGNNVQQPNVGPTGVPDPAHQSIAPIPVSTETIPFSSTASFLGPDAFAPATPAPQPNAKAPADEQPIATTLATSTVAVLGGNDVAPAPAPTSTAQAPQGRLLGPGDFEGADNNDSSAVNAKQISHEQEPEQGDILDLEDVSPADRRRRARHLAFHNDILDQEDVSPLNNRRRARHLAMHGHKMYHRS